MNCVHIIYATFYENQWRGLKALFLSLECALSVTTQRHTHTHPERHVRGYTAAYFINANTVLFVKTGSTLEGAPPMNRRSSLSFCREQNSAGVKRTEPNKHKWDTQNSRGKKCHRCVWWKESRAAWGFGWRNWLPQSVWCGGRGGGTSYKGRLTDLSDSWLVWD